MSLSAKYSIIPDKTVAEEDPLLKSKDVESPSSTSFGIYRGLSLGIAIGVALVLCVFSINKVTLNLNNESRKSLKSELPYGSLSAGATALLSFPSGKFQIKSGSTCLTYVAPASKSGPGSFSFSACTTGAATQLFRSMKSGQIASLGAPANNAFLDVLTGSTIINDNLASTLWTLSGSSLSSVQMQFNGKPIGSIVNIASVASGSLNSVAKQIAAQGLTTFQVSLPEAGNLKCSTGNCCLESTGVRNYVVLRTCSATVAAQKFSLDSTGRLQVSFQTSTGVLDGPAGYDSIKAQSPADNSFSTQLFDYDSVKQNLVSSSNEALCLRAYPPNDEKTRFSTDSGIGKCTKVVFK